MTRYVIDPDVALHLAREETVIREDHRLLAPTLLRSQLLSLLYQAVNRGEMTKKDAERQLDYVRGLRIRLLGDRVLQSVAWKTPPGLSGQIPCRRVRRPHSASGPRADHRAVGDRRDTHDR